jgi:hypothetical protein
MPAFDSLANPPAIYPGDSYLAWNNEAPAVGSLSQEVAIAPVPGSTGNSLAIEIAFSAAPGVFEIDLMTADTDVSTDYSQKTVINGVDANNVARAEVSGVVASFAALQLVALANAVNITAKITSR